MVSIQIWGLKRVFPRDDPAGQWLYLTGTGEHDPPTGREEAALVGYGQGRNHVREQARAEREARSRLLGELFPRTNDLRTGARSKIRRDDHRGRGPGPGLFRMPVASFEG